MWISVCLCVGGRGVIGLISPTSLSSLGSRSGSISRARSSAAAPNASPAYITRLFAGRCCGLMVSHIGHHCLFAGNERIEGKGSFLFVPLFPSSLL